MMRPSNELPAVYLCREAVDFRKGINGLAVLVEEALQLDPFYEQLFVFCNRKRDKVKILYWERNGFCLWQKRLERARFKWPRKLEPDVITLTGQQLNWLLDGYDIMRLQPHKRLHFSSVFIDIYLLAATALAENAWLWTGDKRLKKVASKMKLAFDE